MNIYTNECEKASLIPQGPTPFKVFLTFNFVCFTKFSCTFSFVFFLITPNYQKN